VPADTSELFRFPAARRHDPAVDAWLDAQEPELGWIARAWFVRELLHDGCPVACVQDAAFAYVNVFKSHVSVGFYLGADLDDPAGLLEGSGKRMRHVKLRPGVEPDLMALRRLIEDAHADMLRRLD
jgi:hypothetical protein